MDWDAIKNFQPLIVGLVGLPTLALTLYVNSAIPRWQKDRENEHKAEALRRLLCADLEMYKADYEENLVKIEDMPADATGLRYLRMSAVVVYEKSIEHLGLLHFDEIGVVVRAYDEIMGLEKKMDFWSEGNPKGDGYFVIPVAVAADAIEATKKTLAAVTRAVGIVKRAYRGHQGA